MNPKIPDHQFKPRIYPMRSSDLELVYAWRQDREVMQFLPSAPTLTSWNDHWNWWTLRESGREDWMIIIEDLTSSAIPERRVGVVHLDRRTHEVGIIIGEKGIWGHGIATSALRLAVSESSGPTWAIIHPQNIGSQRAFMKAGFERVGITSRSRHGQEEWRIVV